MSFQALSWAYGLSLGSAPQKAVLIYLAQFAHEDGTCTWPSVLNIQVATELSERAVRKALRELQDKGLIMPGDQRHAALGKNGGTVPRGRRSKVWDLRLNMPVEEFNGVERAEDVRERLRGEERERKVRERERKHPKPQENMAETASESQSEADSKDIKKTGCTTCTPRGACGAPRLFNVLRIGLGLAFRSGFGHVFLRFRVFAFAFSYFAFTFLPTQSFPNILGTFDSVEFFDRHVQSQVPDLRSASTWHGAAILAKGRVTLVTRHDQALILQFPQRLAHGAFAQFGSDLNVQDAWPGAGTILVRELRKIDEHGFLRCGTETQTVCPRQSLETHLCPFPRKNRIMSFIARFVDEMPTCCVPMR
nr:MAG TPA: helix-turn-helix domain protein [Bacteriophage sp.]